MTRRAALAAAVIVSTLLLPACGPDTNDAEPAPSAHSMRELCAYPQAFLTQWYKVTAFDVTVKPATRKDGNVERFGGCLYQNADTTPANIDVLPTRYVGGVSLGFDDGRNVLGSADGRSDRPRTVQGVPVTATLAPKTADGAQYLTLSAVLDGWRGELEIYVKDENAPQIDGAAQLVVEMIQDLRG
ncbi:hypothetical protein [Nocardia brasiliensis]|uniref:Lipoprotein n=1 Tax=Nocardia brasiliensis (strain ATCC 700358 / HUJEG-1) TaxID=1133849 RepID=K0ESY0_NOCB7|nr:hypothetical protein [Nocardia brasiliensis]AFU02898.1 hypothetical protein O3I_024735 [Nocardia brasiliensis ATCC 700358]